MDQLSAHQPPATLVHDMHGSIAAHSQPTSTFGSVLSVTPPVAKPDPQPSPPKVLASPGSVSAPPQASPAKVQPQQSPVKTAATTDQSVTAQVSPMKETKVDDTKPAASSPSLKPAICPQKPAAVAGPVSPQRTTTEAAPISPIKAIFSAIAEKAFQDDAAAEKSAGEDASHLKSTAASKVPERVNEKVPTKPEKSETKTVFADPPEAASAPEPTSATEASKPEESPSQPAAEADESSAKESQEAKAAATPGKEKKPVRKHARRSTGKRSMDMMLEEAKQFAGEDMDLSSGRRSLRKRSTQPESTPPAKRGRRSGSKKKTSEEEEKPEKQDTEKEEIAMETA